MNMKDTNPDSETPTLETRHRHEQKQLRAKIQAMKKSVAKGDRKRKKEVLDEIARMEAETEQRHLKEKEEEEKEATTVMAMDPTATKDSDVPELTEVRSDDSI
jgi:OTU domain-containing protein 6